MRDQITFTKFTSIKPLSKEFSIDDAGVISKHAAAQMTKGKAERMLMSPKEFSEALSNQPNNVAFGYGQFNEALPDTVNIVLSGKEDPTTNSISRTKKHFVFTKGASVLMLDHDPCEYGGTHTPEGLIEVLALIHPEIASCTKIIRGSLSTGVSLVNAEPSKGKGFHIYIPVKDASLIPEYVERLRQQLWAEGFGYIALNANGGMLERLPIDMAVFSPERLDFVGSPVIKSNGLIYTPPEVTYIDGGLLDLSSLAEPDVLSNHLEAISTAKLAMKDQSKAKKEEWVASKFAEMIANGANEDQAKADIEASSAAEGKDLYGSFILYFADGRTATVAEVIANHADYGGKALADPFEGVAYGKTTAKFYWNNGKPVVNSNAHGGSKYFLHTDVLDDFTIEGDATNKSVQSSHNDEWKRLLTDHVTQWNLDNFSTILGGSHRIGRWEDPEASADNVRTLKYYTSEALSKVHANTLIQTGIKTVAGTKRPVYSNHFEAWYKNTKSASHTGGVIFLPSNKPLPPRDISSKYYNTWEGYSVNPVQNEELLVRLKFHIKEVICSGDESLYDYIYKWFAYIFQYPELPAGSAIVLRGLEGAGKGLLGSFIQSLWGIHGVKIGSSKHLTGSFNALLANACFTFADEAFFSGDRQQADVLKGLVTESTFNIERKGVDTVTQTNYLKILMSTNSDYAVPAGKDSRRYFVSDVSPKYLNDKSYFDPLVADCKSNAVKSAFLYDMLNMDLTCWSTSQIPDSEGLRSQRYHSMDTVKKWFVDVLIKGTVKGDFDNESGDYWDDKVSSEELFTNYLRWCDQAKAGEYKRLVQCELVKYLSKIFSSARDVGGRGKRGIIFGNLTNAIDKFESYEKIFIHELTSDTAF